MTALPHPTPTSSGKWTNLTFQLDSAAASPTETATATETEAEVAL